MPRATPPLSTMRHNPRRRSAFVHWLLAPLRLSIKMDVCTLALLAWKISMGLPLAVTGGIADFSPQKMFSVPHSVPIAISH
jgi:hypothetical protein